MLIGYVCFRAESGPRDESGLKVRQVPIADLGLSWAMRLSRDATDRLNTELKAE